MLKGKKILFYLPSLELGGSERFGMLIARYLRETCGAVVEVWGVSSPGLVARICDEQKIPWRIELISWGRCLALRLMAIIKLTVSLRRARPDIILAYTLLPSVLCGIVWRLTGAKLCVWHQHDILGYRMGNFFEQLAVRNTPLFISNSHHGYDYLIRFFKVPPEKIKVVYNVVQLGESRMGRSEWRKSIGAGDDDFVAVMVANVHSNKDHITLIRAWREIVLRLRTRNRTAILALAGFMGDTYEAVKQLSSGLDMDANVKFLGQVKDIPGLLYAADMGVFSSVSEGSPTGLLECMAAGLAVAGTDIPGIREAVGPDGYEFLAPPNDASALAEKIMMLALSPEVRRTAGEVNRERAATVFNPLRICEEMISLIDASFS